MKKNFLYIPLLLAASFCIGACSDETKESSIGYPNDVTFSELDLPNLTYKIPDANYSAKAYHAGSITFNVKKNADGTHSGFALSSRNYRSYPWTLGSTSSFATPTAAQLKAASDTCIYSVYSGSYPNQLGTFAVARVDGDEAYFTLDKPRVVEHLLVANTTYNYLLLNYGSHYSSTLNATTQMYQATTSAGAAATVRNPNIPHDVASKFRIFYMTTPNGDIIRLAGQQILYQREKGHEAAEAARTAGKTAAEVKTDSTNAAAATVKGYFKITAKGFKGGTQTGSVDYYLATLTGVAPAPYDKWNIIQSFWAKMELATLGEVDKVVFYLDSSDKDALGNMRTPPYFCIDGIRLSN